MCLVDTACLHYAGYMHKHKSWALITCVINKSLLVRRMRHVANVHVCIGLAAYDRAEMLVIFRDSEQEPEQELDPTSLDDHLARSGAAWLLQRFSGSDSVLAMRGAFSGFNKDKPEKPHSLNKEALGGADAQQASSAARMSISARFRASALGRSSGTAVE